MVKPGSLLLQALKASFAIFVCQSYLGLAHKQRQLQAQQRFQVHGKEQVCNRMLRESAVNSIRGVFRELSKEISPILLQARQTQDSDMLVHSCPVDALNIVKLKVERVFLELFHGIALSWAQEKWNPHPNKKTQLIFDMPGPCVHE